MVFSTFFGATVPTYNLCSRSALITDDGKVNNLIPFLILKKTRRNPASLGLLPGIGT